MGIGTRPDPPPVGCGRDDAARAGRIVTYLGEGEFTDDELKTFGNRAVVRVPGLQKLKQVICRRGFEHHAAMNASSTARVLEEAFERYMDWEVYRHPTGPP